MNIFKAFVYMFYAIDAAYDECPDEELGNYLSGLNPFLFKGEVSANPAEYEEFKQSYLNLFGTREPDTFEIYDFCKEYLVQTAPLKAVIAFVQTEREDWIAAFNA